jgi:LysR family transcriptional regulator, regulator for bpeEF and oprC
MDRLKSLTILARTIELGSFSKCASEFGLTQPTISKAIEDLEIELGIKIISRTTRSLSLTEEGKQIFEKAKHLVELYDELLLESKSKLSPQGILRVTCPTALGSLYFMDAINKFMKQYPEIKILLRVTDSYLDLVEEGIDVALRVGELLPSLNIAKYVGALPRIAVANEVYLHNRTVPEKLSELVDHSCIAVSRTATNIFWEAENKTRQKIEASFILDNYLGLRAAVTSGLGIGLGGRFLFEDNGTLKKNLVRVLTKTSFKPYPVNLVFRDAKTLPLRARLFIDFFYEDMRKQSWLEK